MLPGVTAGGVEGEAPSPARPGSPTSLGPQTATRTLEAARGRRKTSSGSSLLHLPPGKDAASVVPCSAVLGDGIQAGNQGEMWGGSKADEPLVPAPLGAPAGVRALRHVEHPENESKW